MVRGPPECLDAFLPPPAEDCQHMGRVQLLAITCNARARRTAKSVASTDRLD